MNPSISGSFEEVPPSNEVPDLNSLISTFQKATSTTSERGKKLFIMDNCTFGFHKNLKSGAARYTCTRRGCSAFLKIVEPDIVVEKKLVHCHYNFSWPASLKNDC